MAPYYEVLEDVHSSVESPPALPEWPAVNDVLSRMVDDVINERSAPEDAVAAASVNVKDILE